MTEGRPTLGWRGGRVADRWPSLADPGLWSVALLATLVLLAGLLAAGPARRPTLGGAPTVDELHAVLEAASGAPTRAVLVVGGAVVGADASEHGLGPAMRRELGPGADLEIHDFGVEGLLPTDLLAIVTALDRLDPRAEVELAIALDLRAFAARHAEQHGCSRAELCALNEGPAPGDGLVAQGWSGLVSGARAGRRWVRRRLDDHRRPGGPLPGVDALAVAREPGAADDSDGRDELWRADYRSATLDDPDHAQLRAFDAVSQRLAERGRRATWFLPPQRDDAIAELMSTAELGRRYSALAGRVHATDHPTARIIDLDHPLFATGSFDAGARLTRDGVRILAINLLHELGLPLARRPFEHHMVHPEGFDRSLVHRASPGASEGGAWMAALDRPDGVASDRGGQRVIVADTGNHVLRELRGAQQIVEIAAGTLSEAGDADGDARKVARLDHPRGPALRGDAVWFIDGGARERVRVLDRGIVRTVTWDGPGCAAYRSLRMAADAAWLLCENGRLIRLELAADGPPRARNMIHAVATDSPTRLVSFDLDHDTLYYADASGSLWRRSYISRQARLGGALSVFHNPAPDSGVELLPTGKRIGYPYEYGALRLAEVVDLRFVERYGGLLVADALPAMRGGPALREAWTERVMLRYFDLPRARVLPWAKALAHGEAHAVYNNSVGQFSSYWHLGSMAVVQGDASLLWLERERSRLIRVADGLLGVAKTGNHHTQRISIPRFQTLAKVARKVEAELRPDRYIDSRDEPLARAGPFIGLVLGSSLSSMSDRYSNYSLGRRLELELQRELGYRAGIRLDLFQISHPAATLADNINNFDNWLRNSVPPDVVFIEAHDFGGSLYLRKTKEPGELTAAFAKLAELAERYDTLVVFYDVSSLESNKRESMQATDRSTREVLAKARRLGFTVLEPGDWLFARLLTHSPWGCQPFAANQHHGSTWAVEMTAQTLATMIAPTLRERFSTREPARWSERPASEFQRKRSEPLSLALVGLDLDGAELVDVPAAYVQTEFVGHELFVSVDLAGFGDALAANELERLAVSVILDRLSDDLYAALADRMTVELVEFENYDEYGNGVVDSANSLWRRRFNHRALREYLREHMP